MSMTAAENTGFIAPYSYTSSPEKRDPVNHSQNVHAGARLTTVMELQNRDSLDVSMHQHDEEIRSGKGHHYGKKQHHSAQKSYDSAGSHGDNHANRIYQVRGIA